MPKKSTTAGGGYIALMASTIISVILLILTISAGNIGWSTRMAILGVEAKEASVVAAYGCAEYALARVIADPLYIGNATVAYADDVCYVYPITAPVSTSSLVTIRVQTIVRHSYTTLEIQYDIHDIHSRGTPIVRPSGQIDTSVAAVRWREL